MTTEQYAQVVVGTVEPLLELFAVLDAVFTEDDAMTLHKQVSLGRCYEAWQRARQKLDPEWSKDERPRRRIGVRRGDRLR